MFANVSAAKQVLPVPGAKHCPGRRPFLFQYGASAEVPTDMLLLSKSSFDYLINSAVFFFFLVGVKSHYHQLRMADDFDVEALLEAPYKKEVNGEVIIAF